MIGSAPGYVGYEEGGQLSEKVRRKPQSDVYKRQVVCGIAGYYAALSRVRDNYSSLSDNNTAKEDNINNEDAAVLASDNKINPSTKMVYQYYYRCV